MEKPWNAILHRSVLCQLLDQFQHSLGLLKLLSESFEDARYKIAVFILIPPSKALIFSFAGFLFFLRLLLDPRLAFHERQAFQGVHSWDDDGLELAGLLRLGRGWALIWGIISWDGTWDISLKNEGVEGLRIGVEKAVDWVNVAHLFR